MNIDKIDITGLINTIDAMHLELDKIGAKYNYDINLLSEEDADRCAVLVAGITAFEKQLDKIEAKLNEMQM